MVRLQTLDLRIGVRVPASQPFDKLISWEKVPHQTLLMRTIALSSLLLLPCLTAWGQDSSEQAPPVIDDALRARVAKFYEAFIAGKFKAAYTLVADDSQDAFFELDKSQYKGCETIKIHYSENFTKATVVESCKSDWRWHGNVTPTNVPLTSNWEVVDGEWYWHYVKPTMVPSPFSPTGFVPVPSDSAPKNTSQVPRDIAGAARGILSKVGVDKRTVRLRAYETSQDVVRVRNEMPGPVTLKLDELEMAGLKTTLGKSQLNANEETTIVFEYRLDDPRILCLTCAMKITGNPIVQLHVLQTAQVFPIDIVFEQAAQVEHPIIPKK
jgi:hypothetical protein